MNESTPSNARAVPAICALQGAPGLERRPAETAGGSENLWPQKRQIGAASLTSFAHLGQLLMDDEPLCTS